jgi:hypothetical protein
MSQEIDLFRGSSGDDDNGERPNTASVPSLPRSSKRLRDIKELSNESLTRHKNGPVHNNAAGSAEVVVDLELADEVEVPPNKKRRGVKKSERIAKNDAKKLCAQMMKGVEATEQGVGELIQTSRDDGSAIKHSKKLSTSKPSSKASGRQWRDSAWEDRLSELADYRKIHGHCNIPYRYSKNTQLAAWVGTQRQQYRLHREGNASPMMLSRIQELESLGFEWEVWATAWEDRLSELAEYWKLHGHCNVPTTYKENSKLGYWVGTQRNQYKLHVRGKTSHITPFRIQELESMGFEWGVCLAAWEDLLSELTDYRKQHGHCNVPKRYSENAKLGNWVGRQRGQYRLYLEGKTSPMTLSRLQALENLGFEWESSTGPGKGTPKKPRKGTPKKPRKGTPKKPRKGTPKKPRPDDDTKHIREKAGGASKHMQQHSLKKISAVEISAAIKLASLSNPKNPTGMAKSTSPTSRVKLQKFRRLKARDALFDATDLDAPPSELVAKASLYSDKQAAESLTPDKSAPAGNSVESNTRDDAPQAKLSWPARQPKRINSFSHAILVSGPPENDFLGPAKKPAKSRRGANAQLETAPSNEMLRVNPAVAEPLEQRHNTFTHDLLFVDGSTGNEMFRATGYY